MPKRVEALAAFWFGVAIVLMIVSAAGSGRAADAGPAEPPPGAFQLAGRVTERGAGVPEADVLLYRIRPGLAELGVPVALGPSGPDGSFSLVAPEGSYLLMARKGDRFAYFGRNPLRLTSSQRGLHLPLVPSRPPVRERAEVGREFISGRVLRDGRPLPGGQVFAYLEVGNGVRGPGYAVSEPTGPDGRFRLALPPGTYFLAARVRRGPEKTGPLQAGDLFGVCPEFPLILRQGEAAAAEIEVVELPSPEQMARFQGRFAKLSGVVADREGKPAKGVRVCLYPTSAIIGQPLAVSEPTGTDGTFVLETPLSGHLYLGAREALGGPPRTGERVGFLVNRDGGRVDLEPGARLEGLRIAVQALP